MDSINQQIQLPLLEEKGVTLFTKREDLLHPIISGNKYRKLKYNVLEAKEQGLPILTFGGAYSNHIAATAYAGKHYNIKTIGVIRGEELATNFKTNPTLRLANEHGMQFKFIARSEYQQKHLEPFINQLKNEFGDFYLIPEGGTNTLAIKGCEEILNNTDEQFNFLCCPVGTGGTVTGLINASKKHQKVLGFSALKGDFLTEDIRKFALGNNWELVTNHHFGGYAKTNNELITFINWFKKQTKLQLDPIYTGKMMFGILDMIKQNMFKPGTKILAIHTGGLQGITGINAVLKKKNREQIDFKFKEEIENENRKTL